MYSLKDAIGLFAGDATNGRNGAMYCFETNAVTALRTNETQGFFACFVFTLVERGWLTIRYNGHELTFYPDDLYTYSPGLPVTVIATSDDFYGLSMMADEHAAIDMPTVHDLVHIAYLSIVQLHEPKQTLPADTARHLAAKMREIIGYLQSDHIYKAEVLRLLYAVFLLDLQNAQHSAIVHQHVPQQVPQRVEEIFIGFIRLLPDHFAEHHNIPFYASALHISPVYLSRVVRQVTGRTVVDYINYMLLMEASFLLRNSELSITQIADRLHFADTPSFSKFFTRMNGQPPSAYRNKRM